MVFRSLNILIVDLQALPYARAVLLWDLFEQARSISQLMTSQILRGGGRAPGSAMRGAGD